MTCEQLDEQLPLYAAGGLEGADLARVRSHLASPCPACAGKLAEYEATFGLLALAPFDENVFVPASAKSRLDQLISNDARTVADDDQQEQEVGNAERQGLRLTSDAADGRDTYQPLQLPRHRSTWWVPTAVAACLAAGITAGLMYFPMQASQREVAALTSDLASARSNATTAQNKAQEEIQALAADRAQAREQVSSLQAKITQVESRLAQAEKLASDTTNDLARLRAEKTQLDEQLVSAQRELAMLFSKQLLTVSLKGQDASPNAQALLLVDLKQKIWKLYATDLKPMDGRVYEFWLITADGTKVPMGSFNVDREGRGTLSDKVPDPLPQLAAAAITDEPGPGAKQPTGPAHVVGKIQ